MLSSFSWTDESAEKEIGFPLEEKKKPLESNSGISIHDTHYKSDFYQYCVFN